MCEKIRLCRSSHHGSTRLSGGSERRGGEQIVRRWRRLQRAPLVPNSWPYSSYLHYKSCVRAFHRVGTSIVGR